MYTRPTLVRFGTLRELTLGGSSANYDFANASNNTCTTYLYNYGTHAWDTFYSSSGTPDLAPPAAAELEKRGEVWQAPTMAKY